MVLADGCRARVARRPGRRAAWPRRSAPTTAPADHAADTVAAGAGLVDDAVARVVTEAAPDVVAWLSRPGRPLRPRRRRLARARPGGRPPAPSASSTPGMPPGPSWCGRCTTRPRRSPGVAHRERPGGHRPAAGRATGWSACSPGRAAWQRAGRLAGAGRGPRHRRLRPPVGGHDRRRPRRSGDGVAMAARAGATLADLEFVQFHPTRWPSARSGRRRGRPGAAADRGAAGRGRGARRRDRPPLLRRPRRRAAPRDVVARAIYAHLGAGPPGLPRRPRALGDGLPERFPTVFAHCARAGLDPRREPIPVSPAAHYCMGGVADRPGRAHQPARAVGGR